MRVFALPFFLVLLFSTPPALASTELGPIRDPAELESGGLLIRTSDGLRQAPTMSTDVAIEVVGLIARASVTQHFTNPTEDWVEGVYVFPLPEGSAVDSLRMQIGERVIVGHVEERAQAKATYERAKRAGKKASLIEQERPNIFTSSIANLGPGETVAVTITYQEDARYDAGRFSLRFPLVVAPRFIPGTPAPPVEGFSGTGWSLPTTDVPDAPRITPPVHEPARAAKHPVRLAVEIDAGFPLDDVSSSSHSIQVQEKSANVYNVRLANESTPANADFVLEWQPAVGRAPGAALFRETWEGEEYALLMVLPPQLDAESTARVSRETIIAVDTSGSMGGASIFQARRAVQFALDTLHPEDAFNIIEFNSDITRLFEESEPATPRAIERAKIWVDQRRAGGGTNMMPALAAALEPGRESRAVRQIIFVTDGAVGNEAALFGLIERKLGQSRLYTVGIGSAPNSHLMTKAAETGRGTFTYIGKPEEVAEKMGALFRKIASPIFHDLSIDWGVSSVEAWPSRIPDVYMGEPVVVAARLGGSVDEVKLKGRRGDQPIGLTVSLKGGSDHAGVSRLWARRKVASLMDSLHSGGSTDQVSTEVAAIGVRHQLVTRWSSLVAVDVTPTAPANIEPDTRAIPSLLPAGWDFSKVFGTGASKSSPDAMPPVAAPPQQRLRSAAAPGVAVGQPLAMVQIGMLPQGATPSALLLRLGLALVASAGGLLTFARVRGGRP